jgi:hypothetical protein
MNLKLLFTFYLLLAVVYKSDPTDDNCGIKNTSFKAGENVGYKIYYTLAGVNFEAGIVHFNCMDEQLNGKAVYHITATGKTIPFYDHLYKVRDRYETYIDTASLLPYRFTRSTLEGRIKKYENIQFNRGVHTVISDSGVFKVPACVQDVLGALYYIRNMPVENLRPGDKIDFEMFLDNRLYKSYIRFMGREMITTRYGKFHAIKIKPLLIKGSMFEAGEKMTVWVTDDPNHIPIRVQAAIRIGNVRADLVEFQNNRWPLQQDLLK